MKRVGFLYRRIWGYENLCLAYVKAARGKSGNPEVVAFRRNFDENIQDMREQLERREPKVGDYRTFEIYDPKRRKICAPAFPERVLHHAIMNICVPVLEKSATFDSYACRIGKGNRRAVFRARKFAGRFPWYLKLDIRKYFDSIDHEIVLWQLARKIKDRDVLDIFATILDTYHTDPGKGVPIGALVSQHLANFYLTGFDHWVKRDLKVRGYVRYMDDFLLFGPDKAFLKDRLRRIAAYLENYLSLKLKENIQLNRCDRGIPFLGFRVFPWTIRLTLRSRKRFVEKFRKFERKYFEGEWSIDDLIAHTGPLFDFTTTAEACEFRRNIVRKFGASF